MGCHWRQLRKHAVLIRRGKTALDPNLPRFQDATQLYDGCAVTRVTSVHENRLAIDVTAR